MLPMPIWLGAEDSEQDFWVVWCESARHRDVSKFSPTMASHEVGKRIQKARGVEQHRRTGSARFDLAFASLGLSEAPDAPDDRSPEAAAVRAQYYEILRGLCDSEEQLAVISALEAGGGSLAGATALLTSDPTRSLCEKTAVRMIDRAVAELIEAYGKEEEAQS